MTTTGGGKASVIAKGSAFVKDKKGRMKGAGGGIAISGKGDSHKKAKSEDYVKV